MNNPFSYEAATNLNISEVLNWYVPDDNQGPLICSSKNLFLFGERGCGKSMTLRYFSLEAEIARARAIGSVPNLNFIGIYVKCNTPLIWKREYELIKRDDEGRAKAALLSEHILSLWIVNSLVEQIGSIPDLFKDTEEIQVFSSRISFLLDIELPNSAECFSVLSDHIGKRLDDAQRYLAERDPGKHLSTFRGFNSLVVQILMRLRSLARLSNSHFMIMLDDAQDLYLHQREAVNSWIAYRDHSIFSLKVAVARRPSYNFSTANGSSILEIHDYSSLDMQTPYQNSASSYAKFISKVLSTRLSKSGIDIEAEKFFPPYDKFEAEINEARQLIEKTMLEEFPSATAKQLNDYAYKRARALVFKNRHAKSNKPLYAGLNTITEISTGVTRNVLEIAWRSFDLLASKDRTSQNCQSVPAGLQSEAVFSCGERLWNTLSDGLHKRSARISAQDSEKLHHLFNQLGIYFKKRLVSNISEPRVLSFVISEKKSNPEMTVHIERILNLALEHSLLFARPYSSREGGTLEILYTPNKLLWPTYGLDVVGQSGRASIRVSELWNAMSGKEISFSQDNCDDKTQNNIQLGFEL